MKEGRGEKLQPLHHDSVRGDHVLWNDKKWQIASRKGYNGSSSFVLQLIGGPDQIRVKGGDIV